MSQKVAVAFEVEYLHDTAVDPALDRQLRALFTACFPEDSPFQKRRYFRDPYEHRWIIRNGAEGLAAHVGVHHRLVKAGNRTYLVGGICEVCVRTEFRGRGLARLILNNAHEWLAKNGYDYAMLFGDPKVYGSSGYTVVQNLVGDDGSGGRKPLKAMVCPLTDMPWPEGEVYLPGATF